jgi:O-antigen biosynthesis protein
LTPEMAGSLDDFAGAVAPTRVVDVDLARGIGAIARDGDAGTAYRRARVQVRLHGKPLGSVDLDLVEGRLAATDVAARIWESLEPNINRHLDADGLDSVSSLSPSGIGRIPNPRCVQARERSCANGPMISIVLATYGRPKGLARTLDSLAELKYRRFEIVLVDNAPETPYIRELFERESGRFDNLRYVTETVRGLTPARIRGVEAAAGEIVAFTDDDVVVDPYWLAELATAFELREDIACVTGLTLPLELDTPAQMWFEEFGGFSKGFSPQVFNMRENRPPDPLFPYAIGRIGSGNNMAWRVDLLSRLGGFDPRTTNTGAEDISAFFDAITKGFTIAYEPAAIIFHEHRRKYTDLERQMYWYGIGLGAYLTRCVLSNRKHMLRFAARSPAGLRYLVSSKSAKNKAKLATYPRELTRLERRGALRGPFVYLRGMRDHPRRASPDAVNLRSA